jgi:hypothetical protein
MKPNTLHSRAERGSALILATICVIIVAGLGAAFLSLAWVYNKTTLDASLSDMAFHTAEAGLDDAINRLNAMANATWDTDSATTIAKFQIVTVNGTTDPTITSLPLITVWDPTDTSLEKELETTTALVTIDSDLEYYPLSVQTLTEWYDVTNGNKGTLRINTHNDFTGTFNGGTYTVSISPAYSDPDGAYTITSVGTHSNGTRRIVATVNPRKFGDIGDFGLYAKDTIVGASVKTFIDSYLSGEGTYDAVNTKVLPDGTTVTYDRNKGNIGSNSILGLKQGTVMGAGVAPTIDPGAYYDGGTDTTQPPIDIPPITYEPPISTYSTLPNANTTIGTAGSDTTLRYNTLTVNAGKTVTIQGNVTMYVDSTIKMNGSGTFKIADGATLTIYQGNADATLNGQVNASLANPGQWNFYSAADSSHTVKISGGASVAFNAYAPTASFEILSSASGAGTNVYGRVVANTIKVNGNMAFHRDEDLNNVPKKAPKYHVKYFKELLKGTE